MRVCDVCYCAALRDMADETHGRAARLQAVVRGRKERENVGLPGSKKARMFAMRRQIEALNRKQEALMRPPGIRARDSGRGPLERTQSVRSEIG